MNYYKIRITSWNPKIKDLFKDHNRYIIGWEVGKTSENEHVHMYLESPKDRGTLIKRITKLEDYTPGNKFYSFRELSADEDDLDFIKYKAYCIKEGKFEMKGIKPEERELIDTYDYNVKSEKKIKKQQRKTVLQQIEESYFGSVVDGVNRDRDEFVTKEYVVDAILDYYKQSGGLVRQFMIVSLAQTLCLKYVNSYDYQFKNKILESL